MRAHGAARGRPEGPCHRAEWRRRASSSALLPEEPLRPPAGPADARAPPRRPGGLARYDQCRLAGTAFAGGGTEPGAIAGHPALETARAMGAAIA